MFAKHKHLNITKTYYNISSNKIKQTTRLRNMKKGKMEILRKIREKKDVFYKGKSQDSLFSYTPYWPKIEKWDIIDTIKEIVDMADMEFEINKLEDLWNDREKYTSHSSEPKEMQEMYDTFKKLLIEKIEELRALNDKGEEMWKIADWLVEKNMLVQDENGYTPILKIKKQTPKAYLVITKMQLNTTTKEHEEWIPKSQIEERIPVLKEGK